MNLIEARFRGEYGTFHLDVDFSFPAQGVTALFGPSGCGKTKVLRCVAGLDRLTEGRLSVDGEVWQDDGSFMTPHRRPIGYVFQEASLFPHMTVHANMAYGMKRSKSGTKTPEFNDVADLLGLTRLLDRSPAYLSGGERQRVAIGRALMSGPEMLLMDEPLAALDRDSKNEILPYLERLHDYLAIPVIYVSHDISEVERLADYMIVMDEGRVSATGPLIKLLSNPDLPFARMPDAAAVIEGTAISYDERYGLSSLEIDGGTVLVPGEIGEKGTACRLRIAASDVGLCQGQAPEGISILNALEARINEAKPQGQYQVNVFLGLGDSGDGAKLMARITRKSWETLGLGKGSNVIALVKSVALLDSA